MLIPAEKPCISAKIWYNAPPDRTHAKGVHPVLNTHFRLFAVLSLSKGSGGHTYRGSYEPVPSQSSHLVSSFIFRISCLFRISTLEFRISPDLSGHIMRNEPNLPPNRLAQDPKMRNEPNLSPAHAPNARNKPNSQQPIYILQSTIYNPMAQLPPPRVIPSTGLRSKAQRPKAEGPAKTPSPTCPP